MSLIGIRLEDRIVYDSINNFSIKLNDEKKVVEVYQNNNYLGILSSVIGIDEDEFIKKVKNEEIELL